MFSFKILYAETIKFERFHFLATSLFVTLPLKSPDLNTNYNEGSKKVIKICKTLKNNPHEMQQWLAFHHYFGVQNK